MITVDNSGDRTIYTALKECSIVSTMSAEVGSATNVFIEVYDSLNNLLVKSGDLTNGAADELAASLTLKLNKGDYVVVKSGASFVDSQNSHFGIKAQPVETSFLTAVPIQRVAYLKDVKTNGTAGGTFSNVGIQTRDLNNVSGNSEIVDLSLNQFTLQRGTYIIEAAAPAHNTDSHKSYLYSVTDSVIKAVGGSVTAAASSDTVSILYYFVTILDNHTYEIRHQCTTTVASNGFGTANSFGVDEIYTQVKITKLR